MRERIAIIGHTGLLFWNPVPGSVLTEWALSLALSSESRVLDIGCGRAELPLRIAAASKAQVCGVDVSARALELARQDPRSLGVQLLEGPFDPNALEEGFDLVCCVGSSHAISSERHEALRVARGLIRRGGHLILGHGYWQRDPAPEYLAAIGCTESDLPRERQLREELDAAGFEVEAQATASPTDWARYEDAYATNIRSFALENPSDPDVGAMRARIEPWRGAYERWGHETMGFAAYLLSRSSE